MMSAANPLWEYFAGHTQGNGIFKWTHYLDIYHRHLARFVGQPVHLAEVGVLGGGSLAGIIAHLVPMLSDRGVAPAPAARSCGQLSTTRGTDARCWAVWIIRNSFRPGM